MHFSMLCGGEGCQTPKTILWCTLQDSDPGPVTSGFKAQFHKAGGEVWEEWDKYLAGTWNGEKMM